MCEASILREHEALIRKVAWSYIGQSMEPEDILQEARIAFLHALRTHNASRGPLSNWACLVMRQRILRACINARIVRVPETSIRESKSEDTRRGKHIREFGAAKTSVSDGDAWHPVTTACEAHPGDGIAARYLTRRMKRLSARERAVVVGHVLEEKTLEAVGLTLGISRQGTQQIYSRAIRKLQHERFTVRPRQEVRHRQGALGSVPLESSRTDRECDHVRRREVRT